MTAIAHEAARSALLEAICAIAPETDPAAVLPDRPLRDQIDLDSFDWLNVIIGLSTRLGIEVPERDYAELRTLDSAADYLVRRSAAV
jgi:acyl carrier protein